MHVYHWKHGWIPLDHIAALSKAKGSHTLAARYLAAAHGHDAGIRNAHDAAKAATKLHEIPKAEDRAKAAAQVREAAAHHGAPMPAAIAKPKRGDLAVITTHHAGSPMIGGGRTPDHTRVQLGRVTSMTRDGQVKTVHDAHDREGKFGPLYDSTSKIKNKGTVQYLPKDRVNVDAALHQYAEDPNKRYSGFKSADDARAFLKPHLSEPAKPTARQQRAQAAVAMAKIADERKAASTRQLAPQGSMAGDIARINGVGMSREQRAAVRDRMGQELQRVHQEDAAGKEKFPVGQRVVVAPHGLGGEVTGHYPGGARVKFDTGGRDGVGYHQLAHEPAKPAAEKPGRGPSLDTLHKSLATIARKDGRDSAEYRAAIDRYNTKLKAEYPVGAKVSWNRHSVQGTSRVSDEVAGHYVNRSGKLSPKTPDGTVLDPHNEYHDVKRADAPKPSAPATSAPSAADEKLRNATAAERYAGQDYGHGSPQHMAAKAETARVIAERKAAEETPQQRRSRMMMAEAKAKGSFTGAELDKYHEMRSRGLNPEQATAAVKNGTGARVQVPETPQQHHARMVAEQAAAKAGASGVNDREKGGAFTDIRAASSFLSSLKPGDHVTYHDGMQSHDLTVQAGSHTGDAGGYGSFDHSRVTVGHGPGRWNTEVTPAHLVGQSGVTKVQLSRRAEPEAKGVGPSNAEKIKYAAIMYGTGSKQHLEAQRRFSPTVTAPAPKPAAAAPKSAGTIRTHATMYDQQHPSFDKATNSVEREALYKTESGHLAVAGDAKRGYQVYSANGITKKPVGLVVPHTISGEARHPAAEGALQPRSNTFRTKTAAKKYMDAVAASGILPEDKPATRENLTALRDWIGQEASNHQVAHKFAHAPLNEGALADIKSEKDPSSAQAHLNAAGTDFTPERKALHHAYIAASLSGVTPEREKKYTMMGGGPASGKSSIIKARRGTADELDRNRVTVNADIAKTGGEDEGRPDIVGLKHEFQGQIKAGNLTTAAGYVHEESSVMAKKLNSAALHQHLNVLNDGVGNGSVKGVIGKLAEAKAAGYKTEGVYVSSDTHTALVRAVVRGYEQKRYVNPAIVYHGHTNVSNMFNELATHPQGFDHMELWNTDAKSPVKLASAEGGNLKIHDQAGYDHFLSKGQLTYAQTLTAAIAQAHERANMSDAQLQQEYSWKKPEQIPQLRKHLNKAVTDLSKVLSKHLAENPGAV
jgi:hypothetical protein